MGKRNEYSEEFKMEAVALVVEQKVSIPEVAQDLGISESALRKWIHRSQEAASASRGNNLGASEREELLRLRRENKILREERTILKKAAAFFAKENP